MADTPSLHDRACLLKLHGLLEHWDEICDEPWLPLFIEWEEEARRRRSLERRLRRARLGRFKPIADFNWAWPKKIDREQVEDLLGLDWVRSNTNVVLVGPNGVGKTMIAKNLAHQAVLAGFTVKTVTASEMLNGLAEIDSSSGLNRREWSEVFPSATCVTTIVDRLVHRCEVVQIHADSYRLKESKEDAAARAKDRKQKYKGKDRS